MIRTAGWLAFSLCCGTVAPAQEVALRVSADRAEVGFGLPFEVTVERAWPIGIVPDTWDDRLLEPLAVRPLEHERRDVGVEVRERRRYQAFAFQVGEFVIPSPAAVSGPGVEALRLVVHSSLPAADGGAIELPADLQFVPIPWLRWSIGAVVGFAMLAGIVTFVRARAARAVVPAVMPPAAPTESPLARARRRLELLRGSVPDREAAIEAFYVEASGLVRDYIEERFAVRAPEMTTEEFLAAPDTARALGDRHRGMLGEFLLECDLVKFAKALPTARDATRMLDTIAAFLTEAAR